MKSKAALYFIRGTEVMCQNGSVEENDYNHTAYFYYTTSEGKQKSRQVAYNEGEVYREVVWFYGDPCDRYFTTACHALAEYYKIFKDEIARRLNSYRTSD